MNTRRVNEQSCENEENGNDEQEKSQSSQNDENEDDCKNSDGERLHEKGDKKIRLQIDQVDQ